MRLMTATEASRSFSAVLDAAEHGETIIVTRGGRRIAMIGPAPVGNGAAVNDVLGRFRADADFATDVSSARALLDDEANRAGRGLPRGHHAHPCQAPGPHPAPGEASGRA